MKIKYLRPMGLDKSQSPVEGAVGAGTIRRDKKATLFMRTFKKLPETMTEWDNTVRTVMVEKAIVHSDGGITFVYKNKTDIRVK